MKLNWLILITGAVIYGLGHYIPNRYGYSAVPTEITLMQVVSEVVKGAGLILFVWGLQSLLRLKRQRNSSHVYKGVLGPGSQL